jgi:RimJ/RimL family protein N-acetyltransferase
MRNTHTDKDNMLVVEQLLRTDASEIEALLKEVWPKALEYPESWREARAISQDQIMNEMNEGFIYFGARANGRIVGLYKILIGGNICIGEHQSVHPSYRCLGLGKAMYKHFVEFAEKIRSKRIYVNILPAHVASVRLVETFGFRKIREYEQTSGMLVHLYEKEIGKPDDQRK